MNKFLVFLSTTNDGEKKKKKKLGLIFFLVHTATSVALIVAHFIDLISIHPFSIALILLRVTGNMESIPGGLEAQCMRHPGFSAKSSQGKKKTYTNPFTH